MKSRMFDFISCTRNPLGGECYGCVYCYIHGKRGMKRRFERIRDKYSGEPRLYEVVFNEKIKEGYVVFFCDCIDYFYPSVSDEMILRIYEWIERNPRVLFLSLTKNPIRYLDFVENIPLTVIIGATIESDISYHQYSDAPLQFERIKAMIEIANEESLSRHKRFLSIEPILKFNCDFFLNDIEQINPSFGIAMGYDNYNYKLDEPRLIDTLELRNKLIQHNFRVFDKTLRKSWWEQ